MFGLSFVTDYSKSNKMSWDSYAQNIRLYGAPLASVYGFDGNLYSSNDSLALGATQAEAKKICDIIRNKDVNVFSEGTTIAGSKYAALILEDGLLVLKEKTDNPSKRSACFTISNTILVGAASKDDSVKAEKLRASVEAVRDYLISVNC